MASIAGPDDLAGSVVRRDRGEHDQTARGESQVPIVTIQLFTGRTREQKLRTARAISDALVDHANATPDTVHVIFRDVERDDWLQSKDLAGTPRSGSGAR